MSVQRLALRAGNETWPLALAVADRAGSADILCAAERARHEGFRFAAKRDDFLLGRRAAKSALGALLDEPDLARIEIRNGIHGQPLALHPRAAAMDVSVSHSRGRAVAIAFPAAVPLGIDLETVSSIDAAAVSAQLQPTAAEQSWRAACGLEPAAACAVLWTAREAQGKALRLGINGPLGMLALSTLEADGGNRWRGIYAGFPRCACLVEVRGGRACALALPAAATLDAPLDWNVA